MSEASQTSVVGTTPEITAPVRLEGQSDGEVLFNWLVVNRYLWMLDSEHDGELECIVGRPASFRLGYLRIQWKRDSKHDGHPALVAPEDDGARRAAFARLERLIEHHLLDPREPNSREGESP